MDHHKSLYIAVVSMVVTASCPLRCPPSCKDQLNADLSDVCGWVCGWQPLCTSFTPTHTSFEYLSLKYTTGISAIYLHTLVVPPSSLLQFVFTDEFSRLTSKCEFWVVFLQPLFACLPCLLFARCVFWEWILHSLDLHKLHGPIQAAMDRLLWFLQTSFAVVHNEQSGGYFTQISLPWAYKSQWPHLSWGIYPAKLMAHG